MALLPKNVADFAEASYWRDFFQNRGEKVFEWYGTYSQHATAIEKYIKPNDTILQIGCGNSTLADELYDRGYKRIVSVDVVPTVIDRQKEKNRQKRPELEFSVYDVTNNTDETIFSSEQFQVVLDKGTLDALLPVDHEPKQQAAVLAMFNEVERVLACGGRYMVISLSQNEVIKLWLHFFRNRNFLLRVQQLNNGGEDDDWRLPTFVFVATKLRASPALHLLKTMDFVGYGAYNSPQRMAKDEDLLSSIQGAQEYALFCYKSRDKDLHDDRSIHLHSVSEAGNSSPRYTIYLTSNTDRKKKTRFPYAVFVVPQGRETEWLYSTRKGRAQLCCQASASRLAVVTLGRDYHFPNLEIVKTELNERVMDFAPAYLRSMSNPPSVPYLSLGEDLGQRTIVYSGSSRFSGEFVVEDVVLDNQRLRRLIFLKSQNLVQSEVRLLSNEEIDWGYLCCSYHRLMLAALAAREDTETVNVVIMGLGGGSLATFIYRHFPNVLLTVVEIDPEVVDVAKKWFGYPDNNPRMNCIVDDALEYTKRECEAGQRYDVVFLDVAGPAHVDGLSCPLPEFIEEKNLDRLKAMLQPNGVLAFNLVARDGEKRRLVQNAVAQCFPAIYSQQLEEDINQVLVCLTDKCDRQWESKFKRRLGLLYSRFVPDTKQGCSEKTVDGLSVEQLLLKFADTWL